MARPLFALRLGLAIALAARIAPAVSAQEVDAWLARTPEAGAYLSIRTELDGLAARARAGLSTDAPLAARLVEAASKGVSPERLVESLSSETDSLLACAGLLRARGLIPSSRASAGVFFTQVDIAFRAGLGLDDFQAAIDSSIASKGRNPSALDRSLVVLSTVAALPLDESSRIALITALAACALPDQKLPSLRVSLIDLLANNLSPAESVKTIVQSLKAEAPDMTPAHVPSGGPAPPQSQPHQQPPASGKQSPPGQGHGSPPPNSAGKRR
jgi:hypothetical protein